MLQVRLVWLGPTSVGDIIHYQVVQVPDVFTKLTVDKFFHLITLILLCIGYSFVVLG